MIDQLLVTHDLTLIFINTYLMKIALESPETLPHTDIQCVECIVHPEVFECNMC